jgi:hypothetical protein
MSSFRIRPTTSLLMSLGGIKGATMARLRERPIDAASGEQRSTMTPVDISDGRLA